MMKAFGDESFMIKDCGDERIKAFGGEMIKAFGDKSFTIKACGDERIKAFGDKRI